MHKEGLDSNTTIPCGVQIHTSFISAQILLSHQDSQVVSHLPFFKHPACTYSDPLRQSTNLLEASFVLIIHLRLPSFSSSSASYHVFRSVITNNTYLQAQLVKWFIIGEIITPAVVITNQ